MSQSESLWQKWEKNYWKGIPLSACHSLNSLPPSPPCKPFYLLTTCAHFWRNLRAKLTDYLCGREGTPQVKWSIRYLLQCWNDTPGTDPPLIPRLTFDTAYPSLLSSLICTPQYSSRLLESLEMWKSYQLANCPCTCIRRKADICSSFSKREINSLEF